MNRTTFFKKFLLNLLAQFATLFIMTLAFHGDWLLIGSSFILVFAVLIWGVQICMKRLDHIAPGHDKGLVYLVFVMSAIFSGGLAYLGLFLLPGGIFRKSDSQYKTT